MAEILATYSYTLNKDNSSYSVSCNNKDSCTKAIIPSEYSGLPVTSISISAFENCRTLESIIISENIKSVGANAFLGCYRLVEVVNKSTKITVKKGDSL